MRLGTCVALELAVVAGAIGGAWFGVVYAAQEVSIKTSTPLVDRLAGVVGCANPESSLEDSRLPRRRTPVRGLCSTPLQSVVVEPVRSEISQDRLQPERPDRVAPTSTPPVVAHAAPNNIYGAHDRELLAPLGAARLEHAKLNHGGSSLSLRLDFANGSRAAFKPDQIHPQSDPRKEIAAFRIDRLLRIGHVPPAKPTTIALADLLAAVEPEHRAYYAERLRDEATLGRGDVLRGELSWWIPEIQPARLGPHRIDEPDGRERWTEYLQAGASPPPELRPMLEQISACIVFDLLINNADRWSGSNTTMSPDGTLLYFMDNTLAFSIARVGNAQSVGALRRVQVFSRSLVRRIRELTRDDIVAALASPDGDLGPLLNPTEIRAIGHRRDYVVRYVDRLIERHGEAAVLAFP